MPKHLRKRTKNLAQCRDEYKASGPDYTERNKRHKRAEPPEDAEPLLKHAYRSRLGKIAKSWKLKTDSSKCYKAAWLSTQREYKQDKCLLMPGMVPHRVSRVRYNYSSMPAARAMLLMTQGSPKDVDAVVAHKCGQGHLSCCNPKHLYWADDKQNARDRVLHDVKTPPLENISVATIEKIVADQRMTTVTAWEYGVPVSQVREIQAAARSTKPENVEQNGTA